jgi:hypothetical protein
MKPVLKKGAIIGFLIAVPFSLAFPWFLIWITHNHFYTTQWLGGVVLTAAATAILFPLAGVVVAFFWQVLKTSRK